LVHAPHVPVLEHTWPEPHAVPAGRLPVSVHTGAPVEQSIAAVWHGFVDVHGAPAVHATQLPAPLHTPPGHAVPADALPVVPHTGTPVAQPIAPWVHGLPVEQDIPLVHAPQLPALEQTMFVPHDVPAGRLPLSVQTGTPLVHTIDAVWHGFDDVHAAPAVHAPHVPVLEHTMFVPHELPTGRFPVSVHTGAPLVQSVTAVWHGFVDAHAAPLVHAPHAPALEHTMFVPHDVPAGRFPASVHTGAPLVQSVTAVWHGFVDAHAAPLVHAPHAPALEHTMFVPHDVPAATAAPATHAGDPDEQSSAPAWHGVEGVHAMPVTHAPHVPTLEHT
jgi:hypothetical protein